MTKQPHARESMTNNAIIELYKRKLITQEQEEAARTLYRSCLQSLQRTTDKTKPSYEGVQFLFDSPLDMAVQFITLLPNEWAKWQALQVVYQGREVETDGNLRPSIDRINSNGHYALDNIQADTMKGNYTDASNRRRKPVAIMVVENGHVSFKTVESQTIAQEELNVSSTKLNKMKSQPYDLFIENEAGDLIDTGKQIFAIPSYTVTRTEFLQMEIERLKQNKVEYEAEGVNMDWVNDKVAVLNEQINNPVAMKAEQDKQDRESYEHLKVTIARQEALPVDEVDTKFLEALHRDKLLYERFGWDKL